MAIQAQRIDFEQFIYLPENVDKNFELIIGEIYEVVSNSYSSEIAARILLEIGMFIKGKNMGRITGADGGYEIGEDRYIPDVAFISYAKQPESSKTAYNPNPPDLAVEVLSPNDDAKKNTRKVVNYLNVGVVVWVVDPEGQTIDVYAPKQKPQTLTRDDTLDGGDVLPGFALPVRDIFPDTAES